jgi:acyl-coenzyme A synthetase/AMP-(fatty) acid ligase
MPGVRRLVAIGGAPGWALPLEEVRAAGEATPVAIDVDEDAGMCIQPTTGTTGPPKPWLVTHRGFRTLVAHNLMHLDVLDHSPVGADDVNLHVHALQWASGAQTLFPYMLRGARTVVLDDSTFDPGRVADAITDSGATGLLLPGPMLAPLLDAIEARPTFEHRLHRLVTLFATPELLARTTAVLGPVWCHGYGSTEQGAPVTRLTAAEAAADPRRLASVGATASPLVEVAVLDDAGGPLPSGSVGEIAVRSAMSSSRYWDQPALTEAAFGPGGWFRSRDLGYLDDDGSLYYVDRARDEILTARGAVYPHAVEEAVLRHPAVAGVGAVGLGDPHEQEVVAAVTLKRPGGDRGALVSEIAAAAAVALPGGTPPRIVVVEELPTVLGGAKVQRDVLRGRLAEAVEA